jgi:hypothetical protein
MSFSPKPKKKMTTNVEKMNFFITYYGFSRSEVKTGRVASGLSGEVCR